MMAVIMMMMLIVVGLALVGGTSWSKPDDAASAGGGVKSAAAAGSLVMPGMLSFADPCYDEHDRARRCVPDFVNAAFTRPVQATSTCGDPPSRLPVSLSGCLPRLPAHGSAVSTARCVIGLIGLSRN